MVPLINTTQKENAIPYSCIASLMTTTELKKPNTNLTQKYSDITFLYVKCKDGEKQEDGLESD